MRRFVPFLVALGLVAAVVVPYLALGGGSFEPTPVADPCEPRERADADGLGETIERIALASGRRRRVRARRLARGARARAAQRGRLRAFSAEHGIDRTEAERAIHDGLVRAVDEAEQDGTLPGLVAPLVRKAAESVPPWLILETLERLGSFLP